MQAHKEEHYQDLARSVIVVAGILLFFGLTVLLFWKAIQLAFLVFGGILLAVFIRGLSNWIVRHTHLPQKVSLFLVVSLLIILFLTSGALFGSRVSHEMMKLMEELPSSVNQIRAKLDNYEVGRIILQETPRFQRILETVWKSVSNFFFTVSGFVFSVLLIFFLGLYLAFDPKLYVNGMLRLFPVKKRPHIHEVLDAIGYILHWWLIGRIFSMAVVGILTGIGLWLLGIPLALTLGVFAGLISFVPYLGPLIAFVPIALLALSTSWAQVFYVTILYLGVQTFESYVITPMVLQRTVLVAPLLTLTAQVVFGMAAGVVGVVFALPVMAAILVVVKYFYIRDILGDEIDIEGRENGEKAPHK